MMAADAVIFTLAGPRLLGDLNDRSPTHVLRWDGEQITVGAIEVQALETLAIPYRVELDDGTSFVCCKETMLLTRDAGAPRFIDQISIGTSLLPCYTKLDTAGYPIYQDPGDFHKGGKTPSDRNRWRRLSRLVAEWKMERRCQAGDVVSYISSDRLNCHPDNLKIEQKDRKATEKKVDFVEPLLKAQEFIDHNNHKVARVFLDTSRNLLSIRGLGTSNFVVGGIFASVDSE